MGISLPSLSLRVGIVGAMLDDGHLKNNGQDWFNDEYGILQRDGRMSLRAVVKSMRAFNCVYCCKVL
jgi:hypothetical protein